MLCIYSFAFQIVISVITVMEIKEGDFLIRKVCKKIPLLVNTHQQSSPVETFSEAFLLLTRPFRRSGC